jgi:hypothetical protein
MVHLIAGQVPYSVPLLINLLLRQHSQLFVSDDGPPQLQVPVELGGFVGPVHGLHGSEQAGAVLHEGCEDELEPSAVKSERKIDMDFLDPVNKHIYLYDIQNKDRERESSISGRYHYVFFVNRVVMILGRWPTRIVI